MRPTIVLAVAIASAMTAPTEAASRSELRMVSLCEYTNKRMPAGREAKNCMPADLVGMSTKEIDERYESYWQNWPAFEPLREPFEKSFNSLHPPPAPPPPPRRVYSEAEIKAFADDRLCTMWRRDKRLAALQEIRRRQVFSVKEGELIAGHQIAIGMTEKAMQCSWGEAKDRNRTVTSDGTRVQWIYGETYVYSENGIVTSWQD